MRKVSYTQMRAELSDILDAIRNGETVVVTQRGRPDTYLNGSTKDEPKKPILFHKRDSAGRAHSGQPFIEVSRNSAGQVMYVSKAPNGEILSKVITKGEKVSFSDALSKTQKKHAKIIKALEDK